ncbi:MAG: hypothetical protein LCH41_05850 [Armatimonadetes bacterium]|nr:hypothetical protein [Armatimonadota bacterium]
MVPSTTIPKLGFGLCILGLLIAVASLIPGVVGPTDFPWPLFVGGFIYLPGAFMAFFATKPSERMKMMNTIRMIRVGFFMIIALIFMRLAQ